MALDLTALRAAVRATKPALRGEIPATMVFAANPSLAGTLPPPPPNMGEIIPSTEYMGADAWAQQWGLMHDMAGGMIQMRTEAPCPLGDQARSEGGMLACNASYELIMSQPALAKVFLSTNGTLMGQLAAVGMHGFACIQIVKASRNNAPIDAKIQPNEDD